MILFTDLRLSRPGVLGRLNEKAHQAYDAVVANNGLTDQQRRVKQCLSDILVFALKTGKRPTHYHWQDIYACGEHWYAHFGEAFVDAHATALHEYMDIVDMVAGPEG